MGRTTTRAVLVVLLLLGAAACGDDDDAGAGGIGSAGDGGTGTESTTTGADTDGAADPIDVDVCSLLEPAEIEAQFSELGAVTVSEGQDSSLPACLWLAEDRTLFSLGLGPRPPGQSVEAATELMDAEPVVVEGLGDEAFYQEDGSGASLNLSAGDTFVTLGVTLQRDLTGVQERLVALAEAVLARL